MRISDWSSDVCSSDLSEASFSRFGGDCRYSITSTFTPGVSSRMANVLRDVPHLGLCQMVAFMPDPPSPAILPATCSYNRRSGIPDRAKASCAAEWLGRESCRERVCQYG